MILIPLGMGYFIRKCFSITVALILFIVFDLNAQFATVGCDNGSRIYTTYLGTTNHYGTIHEVYSSTGDQIRIYNNEDGLNSPKCGEIVPTGKSNAGGNQCWIASYLPPNNTSTGVSWQTKVNITGSYVPCPIDDKVDFFLVIIVLLGFLTIKKYFLININ